MKEGEIIKGGTWDGFELISVYTRSQAIEDGILVDVSEIAKEAGIKYPAAVTKSVWDTYITPDERARILGQSEKGRLWDVLWMFKNAALKVNDDMVIFSVYFIMGESQKSLITLKAVCGPGDEGEPVITIMMPNED